MSKRLINFRGTKDFARVEVKKGVAKKGGGDGSVTIGGPLWLACNPTPFEQAVQGVRRISWSSTSTNKGKLVMGGFALGIAGGAFGGIGGALAGVAIGAAGSYETKTSSFMAVQPVKSFKPMSFDSIKIPCPQKDLESFAEPTFEEFHAALEKERKRQEAIKKLERLKQ